MEKLKKIERVLAPGPSTWLEEALWFEQNRRWLDRAAEIALSVLTLMHERDIPSDELARRMGTSPEHVDRILRGIENLTMECISRLEQGLGTALVEVMASPAAVVGGQNGTPK